MTTISTDSVVHRREDLLATDLSGSETVILDISGGSYYGMRNVGKAIWDHIKSPVTVNTLCDQLVAEFDVDPETCRRETTTFLQELHKRGLIVITP